MSRRPALFRGIRPGAFPGVPIAVLALALAGSAAAAPAVPAAPAAAAAAAAPGDPPPLFDPRRPPGRELVTDIADGFTLAAVGDCIISRPVSPMLAGDRGLAGVVRILRDASVTFGNFEGSAIDIREFRGYPHGAVDDWALISTPDVAADLKSLGFDLLSRANNHALDWGIEGMRETGRHLDEAGLVHAGSGENRALARAPRYLETERGRIGLVSMASSYTPMSDALPPAGQAPGRPGVNAVRTTRLTVVTEEMMRHLAAIREGFGSLRRDCPPAGAGRAAGEGPAGPPAASTPRDLELFETRFVVGDRPGYSYLVDPLDREENLKSIRQGKQHSDLLIATIHAHEEGGGCAEPGDFLPDLARAAIDAGADAFIAHGVHALGPIEIYKRRPIFYGLANFFWSDMQEPMPAGLHERNRELLARAFGDPARATDADLTALLNASGFDDALVFQTVIAVSRFEKGELAEVRLHPVDLGYGMRLTRSGVPRLASPATGRAILERLQLLSRPYGTDLVIERGIGLIRPSR